MKDKKDQDVEKQKLKLQQKKNRLAAEEIKLGIRERKMRTRHLIEVGGLVVKAGLNHLPINTLYGALLSLKHSLDKDHNLKEQWTKLGKTAFDKEEKSRTAIILKTTEKPDPETRTRIRSHGLKWNQLRGEWYGYVTDTDSLKQALTEVEHQLEIIN